MSFSRGHAQELLMNGMAAAKSGDRKDWTEAEYYLEWVLRTDADLDQQTDAWYWLSRVTDDPARKRECLENVLSIRPSNADARRDLAILEGRLKPQDMRANPVQPGAAVVPDSEVESGEAMRFKCPKCGALVTYNPNIGMLSCQFCGTRLDEQGQVAEGSSSGGIGGGVGEQDWVAAIYTEKGHRWALPENRVLECQGCGATVTFSPARVSALCLYCGSPYSARVVAPDADDLREPDGVVPFRFDARVAIGYAREWLNEQSSLLGVPDDLSALAAMQGATPIYLPFWTFDMTGEVRWSGWVRADMDIGGVGLDNVDNALRMGGAALGLFTGDFDITARSVAGMAAKRFDTSNMVHTNGATGVILDDVLVPATTSVPEQTLEKLKYNTDEAVPYKEEMLANWTAEVYSVSMADASLKAREQAVKEADAQIALETSGAAHNMMVDRTGLSVMSYKLLLLPMWTTGYTYRGQAYRLFVNGQSGQVVGEVPRSDSPIRKLFGG